jgi:hypothetical protein
MYEPPVKYLVSSPHGDIVMDEDRWKTPLMVEPAGSESGVTYGCYLEAIKNFISKDGYRPLVNLVRERLKETVTLKDIDEILIRTEKHGALYHSASAEVVAKGAHAKFAVNVAISERSRNWLNREFFLLRQLDNEFNFSYLPKAYFLAEVKYVARQGEGFMLMFLAEWFDGYHEFHISMNKDGKQGVVVWDLENGYKYISREQAYAIYKQASKILTLYYNTEDFSQITPWHHAAGDFVVRIIDKENVDVKLVTARKYESLMVFSVFSENNATNAITALVYFLLNLSVKMRLDRYDGVEKVAWADDFCVDAVMEGFLDALKIKEFEHRYEFSSLGEFLSLLRSFSKEDLKLILDSLIDLHRKERTDDLPVIERNLDRHADKLHSTLENLPL